MSHRDPRPLISSFPAKSVHSQLHITAIMKRGSLHILGVSVSALIGPVNVSAFVVPSKPSHVDAPLPIRQTAATPAALPIASSRIISPLLFAETSSGGDQLRASTGIRPSLHPTTINAISEALLLRHSSKNSKGPIDAYNLKDDEQPLSVALTAGALASDLLEKRKTSCEADGDTASIPTAEECQTVAGRVVGVVMRMRELEQALAARVNTAAWVAKYGEHGSFGVLKSECKRVAASEELPETIEIEPKIEKELTDRVRDDPLFRMCRAECLLAIFLQTVEVPKLLEVGETVAGGSTVDFLDEDRKEVVLS